MRKLFGFCFLVKGRGEERRGYWEDHQNVNKKEGKEERKRNQPSGMEWRGYYCKNLTLKFEELIWK